LNDTFEKKLFVAYQIVIYIIRFILLDYY